MTDDAPDDPSHFGYRQKFWPGWPVALTGVARWISQGSDRYPRNVVDRGRRIKALARDWQRKDAEMCGERHHLEIGTVGEEPWIDDGVGDAWKRAEHPIDQPMLAAHQSRLIWSS